MHGGGSSYSAHVAGRSDGAHHSFWCLGNGSIDAARQMALARGTIASPWPESPLASAGGCHSHEELSVTAASCDA
eukprot:2949599-Lingulodinium_polyedra.AAC.1